MSWRSSQNSDLVVNNLTVNGKLNLTQTDENITTNDITSIDGTNNIDLSTANEIVLNTQSLNLNNNSIINPSSINSNGTIIDFSEEYTMGLSSVLNMQNNSINNAIAISSNDSSINFDTEAQIRLSTQNVYLQNSTLTVDGTINAGNEIIANGNQTSFGGSLQLNGYSNNDSSYGGYIDFTTNPTTNPDYDVRLVCSGGNADESGEGTLNVEGNLTVSGNQTSSGGSLLLNGFSNSDSSYGGYIDFTTNPTTNPNYDVRLVCSGGNSEQSGQGTLNVEGMLNVDGNLTVSGTITSSSNPVSNEFHYASIGGNASSVSGIIQLTNNASNTTNYGVFSSIYYGFSGSGGTYNAVSTSAAMDQIVISNITNTSFTYNFSKTTGNNVNIQILFMVVYSPELNYPKSY